VPSLVYIGTLSVTTRKKNGKLKDLSNNVAFISECFDDQDF